MARIDTCLAGHKLQLCIAGFGQCDGCCRVIEHGERVHGCSRCRWYLCDDCRPVMAQVGSLGVWGLLKNLLAMQSCGPCVANSSCEVVDSSRPALALHREGAPRLRWATPVWDEESDDETGKLHHLADTCQEYVDATEKDGDLSLCSAVTCDPSDSLDELSARDESPQYSARGGEQSMAGIFAARARQHRRRGVDAGIAEVWGV
mmetsp:Transcript_21533/g.61895  ORF Transcript_21533/g.61895 Transcript_21533/m.61895 type:complete len:204 (-) Transcript_21533:165-776(-)|eukprot:CAMPEP_0176056018 /NCGR_PEP_ID=MMETSP0120_2-20121206/27893_1 /TAXON_ID=160619 /ORGANISM="Kryptoperidinium foliaceum, Strain CCMP 1326" /LENGTH=203 /DNA_ID=CAMNT_0017389519 /DNA_START=61 /DNA_END=672 /DNA_ORIENTATION=+